MATAASSSNLFDLVRCDLCLEKYNDSDRLPKLLHCSHTFCLACVQRYYESKLKKKLTCPNCQRGFTVPRGGIQNLNTNIMVISLLDHLAPFTAVDTDDDVAKMSAVPKDKIPEEPESTICGLHQGDKCDFYCDDCRDPLCADCIVSLTEGPHKTHKISKLRDVLIAYGKQHNEALQLITSMKLEGKQRTEKLLEDLALSRDSLMKEAKSKRDKAHQEADRWYENAIANIAKAHDKLHAQILQFRSVMELQELQQYLEDIDLQKINGDLKEARRFLDELQSSVTSSETSNIWPTKFWSVNVGKISDDFTIQLGRITEPKLKLPDVNRFPYKIEKMHTNAEVANPDISKQSGQQQGFRLLSDLPMHPGCDSSVGLTTEKALVCFGDQSIIEMIKFDGNQILTLNQRVLPQRISESCEKYILNNNKILLREYSKGPSFILTICKLKLELVSIIPENYGYIIGAESTRWVAFEKDNRTIQIYDMEQDSLQNQLLQTLIVPSEFRCWGNTSISRHPNSQGTAVVDHSSRRLYIYDHDGRHLHTHKLEFSPSGIHSIACNRRHLYVFSEDSDNVSVLSWSGQLVTTLDTQQLRIPEGQRIYNIAVNEDQFTIAVGTVGLTGVVRSFKTFQCV